MSASSKKKLRKELAAAQLTEKQRMEQAEAKKLKTITVSFVAVMLAVVIIAVGVLGVRAVNNSGIIDKNTVAAVIGEHEVNSVMMNYYLTDYIKNTYQEWNSTYGSSFLSMMGLDSSKPLNEQYYDATNKETWADHFLEEALERAKSDFTLYDKAMAEDFKLSEDEQKTLDSNGAMMQLYAAYYGYRNVDKYLQAIYGYGAKLDSYNEYAKISSIAAAYYNKYSDSLEYNDAAIREYEKDKYDNFSSFTFASYYVNQSDYLKGGTKSEDGKTTTYSDDEKAAALKAAEEVANSLTSAADLDAFDKAIAALEVNKNKKDAASTKNDVMKYTNIPSVMQKWLADKDRKDGDITVIANESTTKDADGKETKTVTGYYVVFFQSRNDNMRPLANVRHLLVKFEGGTTDSSGNKTYSEAEKAKAKEEAEKYLKEWQDGNATEESFIELVKKHSDDGSKDEGGLFEDIHAESNYVDSFLAWSLDVDRKAGDTGVIVSEYGYHVMYYSSDDELTYRDYMITEELRAADVEEWYEGVLEPATAELKKTNRLNLGLALANIV